MLTLIRTLKESGEKDEIQFSVSHYYYCLDVGQVLHSA